MLFHTLFLRATLGLPNILRKYSRFVFAWRRTPKGQTKQVRVIFQIQHFLLNLTFSFFQQPRRLPRVAASLFLFLLDVRVLYVQLLCGTALFAQIVDCTLLLKGFSSNGPFNHDSEAPTTKCRLAADGHHVCASIAWKDVRKCRTSTHSYP